MAHAAFVTFSFSFPSRNIRPGRLPMMELVIDRMKWSLPWMMRKASLFLGIFWCLSSLGCGYQFSVEGPGPVIGSGGEGSLSGPPVRIAIRTLRNNTFEPTLEFKYTRYLRQALQSGGIADVVDDEESADFVLDGTIISVNLPSLAFSQVQTQESRVEVKVGIKVKEQKTGKVRWSRTGTGTAEFFVGASSSTGVANSGLQFNRVLQDRALEQAGQLMAEDLSDGFLIARDQGKFGREKATQPSPLELESIQPSEGLRNPSVPPSPRS